MEKQLSSDIIEEYNYKIKSLLNEEKKSINKVLELKSKRKQIKDILDRNFENII